MSVSSAFYKALCATDKAAHPIGQGIKSVFNFLSGNRALNGRNLYRGIEGVAGSIILGVTFGTVSSIVASMLTMPVLGPLAIPVGLAAGAVGASVPARVNAAYIIGKNENEKKAKAQAAAAKKNENKPAPPTIGRIEF